VSDALKKGGYLHKGMLDVLKAMKGNGKDTLKSRIDGFFDEISLCGPRVVKEPGTKNERQLCQLFVPYGHVLTHFYNELKQLDNQTTNSFLEMAETPRLGKAMARRQGIAGSPRLLGQSMQMKKNRVQQCKAGPRFSKPELMVKKNLYCKGMNHIDLMNPAIKNVALYYLKKDLSHQYTDLQVLKLEASLRYEVKDKSECPSKLFEADDISIQQVAMNADGTIKDWAAVIKLNTDEGGYLKSEMPKCEDAEYLPRTELTVKVYEDKGPGECCQGSKDVEKCEKSRSCKMIDFLNKGGKHFSKEVEVTGTVYEVKDSVTRRRRLLNRGGHGNCRL